MNVWFFTPYNYDTLGGPADQCGGGCFLRDLRLRGCLHHHHAGAAPWMTWTANGGWDPIEEPIFMDTSGCQWM